MLVTASVLNTAPEGKSGVKEAVEPSAVSTSHRSLTALPDSSRGRLAACLDACDFASLCETEKQASSSFWPKLTTLKLNLREWDDPRQPHQALSKLELRSRTVLSALQRAVGLQNLELTDERAWPGVLEAMHKGHCRGLTCLSTDDTLDVEYASELATLMSMDGILPALRELKMAYLGQEVVEVVAGAIGGGACPSLKSLHLTALEDLDPLAKALRLRTRYQGCSAFEGLHVEARGGEGAIGLPPVLWSSSLIGLQEVSLMHITDPSCIGQYIGRTGAKLRTLKLWGGGEVKPSLQPVCAGLDERTDISLSRLELHGFIIDKVSVKMLASAIERGVWRSLQHLDLSYVTMPESEVEVLTAAIGAAGGLPELRSLQFAHNYGWGVRAAVTLFKAIKCRTLFPSLESLEVRAWETASLNGVGFGEAGGKALARVIERCKGLHTLVVDGCGLTDDGMRIIVKDALLHGACPRLTHLDLSRNHLTSRGLDCLSRALQKGVGANLIELSLRSSKAIGQRPALQLASALSSGACPKLRFLDVTWDSTGRGIKEAIEEATKLRKGLRIVC